MAIGFAALGAFAPVAFGAQRVISSPGPLQSIYLNDNLACQVQHAGDADPSFFGGTDPGSCGTDIAVPGGSGFTLYGHRGTALTPVSQSPVSGSGSSGNPFKVTTIADAGSTGVRITQVDSYVVGDEFYRTDITVANGSSSAQNLVLYHAADCYLQDSDSGYGFHDAATGGIYCSANPDNTPAGRVLGFVPVGGQSHFFESHYSSVYSAMNNTVFPDRCDCNVLQDNGTGLSWSISVSANGSVTRSLATAVSPTGQPPNPGDTTPPDTTIDSGPFGPTDNSRPTFDFSSTEAGSTFRCSVDGSAFTDCTTPYRTAPLADGQHTFRVRAVDQAGNVDGSPASSTFMVDTAPPETSIDSGPDGSTGDSTPTFTFSSTEEGSGYLCSLDGGAFAACGPPYTTQALVNGPHSLRVRAVDPAGNVDGSPALREFTVDAAPPPDTTAPDAAITGGPTGETTESRPMFEFGASEPGSTFECRIDSAPFSACASPFRTTALRAGPHTFAVRARDAAGNLGPATTVQFTVAETTIDELNKADPPTLATNVNVGPVGDGPVLIAVRAKGGSASRAAAHASQKGLRFVPLTEARQVPVGSFLDTRRGTVALASAKGRGRKIQSGNFSSGLFQVLQSRKRREKGLTDLKLKGSSFRRCSTTRRGKAGAAALRRRTIRRVHGSAHGHFRTSGRGASATVRGTIWTLADRCDGTLTTVKRGKVAVRDFRKKRTILVKAGKSYLARVGG